MRSSPTALSSRIVPLVAALGLVAATCHRSQPTAPAASVELGREFSLQPGQLATIDGLVIRFAEVRGDSRCPVDVQCVWEGDATVVVTVSGATKELHTARRFATSVTVDGRRLELRRLEPAPRAHVKIVPGDYRAVFVIELGAL
jgi:hypothetical protein